MCQVEVVGRRIWEENKLQLRAISCMGFTTIGGRTSPQCDIGVSIKFVPKLSPVVTRGRTPKLRLMLAAMRRTMVDRDSEVLKNEVRDYWNSNPCGTQFTDLEWGNKAFFDEVERFRYQSQPFMNRLIEFDQHRGERLLEVGCGLGTDLLQFARGGAIVSGVDLTPRSIELVRQRFALYGFPVSAQVADAEYLPFEDNLFDVVYSFGVLHHTPNTRHALEEAHRVLRPGGRLILMLYHKTSLHVLLGAPLHFLKGAQGEKEQTIAEDWVRVFDGQGNPLGKSYTRSEVRAMIPPMSQLEFTSVDPIRRRWPVWANAVNQFLFARRFGFFLIIKGTK